MKTWYCFEIRRPGRLAEYIGKSETTEEAIRQEAAKAGWLYFLSGNLVTIYGQKRSRS